MQRVVSEIRLSIC